MNANMQKQASMPILSYYSSVFLKTMEKTIKYKHASTIQLWLSLFNISTHLS
jgi:hypothetical protein